jgi:hypothetical protein
MHGEMRNVHKILVGKLEEKRPFRKTRSKWIILKRILRKQGTRV